MVLEGMGATMAQILWGSNQRMNRCFRSPASGASSGAPWVCPVLRVGSKRQDLGGAEEDEVHLSGAPGRNQQRLKDLT